jgi:HSP20 family molecular chaperone IbpA
MYYPSIFNDEFSSDFFDEVLNFPFDMGKRVRNGVLPKKRCTTDIKEYDDRYVLEMELPGFAKEEIKAELSKGYLVVSAEHFETNETAEKAEGETEEAAENKEAEVVEEKAPKYLCKERFYGKTERSFYVGKQISKEDIKAEYVNGILTLTIPKKVEKPEDQKEYISIF